MSILPEPAALSLLFVFGLFVGSFLNVCIWRLPAGEQVVKGRSHCRACQRVIPWYDNLPLLSFLLLKGKCRFCKAKISWIYPAVELATGLLFLAIAMRFGFSWRAVIYAVLTAGLIVVAVIDAREKIIPDEVTLPGLGLGLAFSFLLPGLHGATNNLWGLGWAVCGALVGGGFLWLIGTVGSWVFKREAMGGGDVKLMAMVGALIGAPKVLLVNLLVAPLLGSAVGIFIKIRYRESEIPYGPFLAVGTLAALFFGDAVIDWYRSLFITL